MPGMSTRPTTDKVKEALFSMIGPYFDGGLVLDLFAGTGGLGIEALSRGMEKGIFIDIEKKSIDTIMHNLQSARLQEQSEVYRNEAGRALKALAKRDLQFDLVLLDPPYRMKNMDEWLETMQELGLLKEGSMVVIEHDAAHTYPEAIGGLTIRKHAVYGEIAVTVYLLSEPIELDNEEME